MSSANGHGSTPFGRLRSHYERSRSVCPACGYEDDGDWRVTATGRRVEFRHRCPSCDAVDRRELRL